MSGKIPQNFVARAFGARVYCATLFHEACQKHDVREFWSTACLEHFYEKMPWENVLYMFWTSVPESVDLLRAWDKQIATTSKHQVKCILIYSSKQVYLSTRCGKVQVRKYKVILSPFGNSKRVCRSSVLKRSQTCINRLLLDKKSSI